jgi:hypothetical protein
MTDAEKVKVLEAALRICWGHAITMSLEHGDDPKVRASLKAVDKTCKRCTWIFPNEGIVYYDATA